MSASLLTGMILASCQEDGAKESSAEPETSLIDSKEDSQPSSEEPIPQPEPSSSESKEPEVKKYKLIYNEDPAHTGVTVTFHDGSSIDLIELTEAKEGQIILINVWDNETEGRYIFKSVLANGVALPHSDTGNFYQLVMPAEDVTITLEYKGSSEEDTPTTTHSITYEDASHPDTMMSVAIGDDNLNDLNLVELPALASSGETIYVNPYSESEVITGVLANGVAAETYSFEGIDIFKFIMPDEDVAITLTYQETETPSTAHTLTYVEDALHPNTFVSFLESDDFESAAGIETAEAGQTVYVMVSYDADAESLTGVFANGIATTEGEYGLLLSSFVMPDADVVITITYGPAE